MNFFFQIWKKLQVQLMIFCYINVETKMEKYIFFSNVKKFTSPANEFLLQKCRKNRNMKKMNFFFQI